MISQVGVTPTSTPNRMKIARLVIRNYRGRVEGVHSKPSTLQLIGKETNREVLL